MKFFGTMTVFLASAIIAGASEKISIVKSGKPAAVIAISSKKDVGDISISNKKLLTDVAEAASELSTHLQKMSGAEIPVRKLAEGEIAQFLEECRKNGQSAILLGAPALEYLGDAKKPLEDPSAFQIKAKGDVIAIAGPSARGTAIGVYELLEQLGIRWFFPGELGTVIPKQESIAIDAQESVQTPTFPARYFPVGDDVAWMKRQRMGGAYFPAAHGIKLGDASVKTHPELYAIVKGVRNEKQVCLSNPEVLTRAIEQTIAYFRKHPEAPWIGLGPNDGSGFCECEKCLALDAGDWDPFSNCTSVTDRYIWFFNQVLKNLPPEFSDKKIAFYIYHAYMRPPVKVKPDPRIAGALAPIGLCRIHGLSNPICPERAYLKKLAHDWAKILPEIYERGYWFNLADPAMPFIQTHRLRDEIPYFAAQKIKGFRTECTGNWALQGPSLYLAGRLLWNADADPDAVVSEFSEKLFGPAAEPMKAYFNQADAIMRDGDHHAGSAFNFLQFYPKPVREKLAKSLAEAKAAAVESPFKERVAIFVTGFDYSDAFARMIEARDQQKWDEANEALQEVDKHWSTLVKSEPPMLNERGTESHMNRFFRPTVEKGVARTKNGNRMLAPLAEKWDSLIDPQNLGQDLGYFQEQVTGGNWQPTSTYSTTWSDLGLRYYKGLAWYRQEIEIPASAKGERVFLWFGGVDESARVWLNGKLLGTSSPSAFVPFEVDATEAIRPGEKNTLVVCVANLKTDELGTGGITAPGFFYMPAAGKDAVLEAIKPLRETFP